MKTILISLSVFVACLATGWAQQFEGIATYKTDRKVDLKMGNEGMSDAMQEQLAAQLRKQFRKEFTLTFNKDESIYEEVESLNSPAPASSGGVQIMISGGSDILYRNVTKNEYINKTEISGKEFLIQDVLEKPEWTLEKETKNIGNYTCFKATYSREVTEHTMTSEADSLVKVTKLRTTTAWYTLDIPVKHGPEDFWGLPGLVLQVEEGDMSILCSKIVLNPEKEIAIEAPKKGKKVTQAQFDKIQEKKTAEMMEQFQSDGRKKGDGSSFSIKIGG